MVDYHSAVDSLTHFYIIFIIVVFIKTCDNHYYPN